MMIADAMRLYFMLRHAGYPEEKCWSDCFNCGKSCVFSLLNENTQYALYFKAIFDFVWIWILCHGSCSHLHEEIDLGFSHVAATTQKTAGHNTRNTAINESQSSRSWSLYNTQCELKKSSHLLWLIVPTEFHPPVVKNMVFTVSRAFFIRGSTSLIEFVFVILFRQEQKILARKGKIVGMWSKT